MENEERSVQVRAVEERREIMNRVVRSFVYIILTAFSFTFGYWIGISAIEEPSASVIDEAVMNTDTDVMAEIWYEVCTEDNKLSLYRVSSMERVLLASEEISSQMFPYEDRRELNSGLIFESFAAAQASFEDFVS